MISFAISLPEPEFYGELVYKLKKNCMSRTDFFYRFRKVIIRYKCIGYNINVRRQTACIVVNPITVNNFASSLSRASDSMMPKL